MTSITRRALWALTIMVCAAGAIRAEPPSGGGASPAVQPPQQQRAPLEKLNEKPKPLLTYAMLDRVEFPKTADLVETIKKRVPDFVFSSESAEGKGRTIIGLVGSKLCTLLMIDAPNPLSPDESFIKGAWWWPSVRADLAKRQAHIVIGVMGADDPRDGYGTLARLAAAVLETSPAIGLIWGAADAVWQRNVFISAVDGAGDSAPTSVLVSVKLGRDTDFPKKDGSPAWLGMTYGLREFGLKEIEYRGFEGEPMDLVSALMSAAIYLVQSGDVIKDGDTAGETLDRQYQFKYEPSTLEAGKQVYRMRALVGAPPALPSEVVK